MPPCKIHCELFLPVEHQKHSYGLGAVKLDDSLLDAAVSVPKHICSSGERTAAPCLG